MLLLYLQKSIWVRASHMDTRTAKDQQVSLHNSMGLWKKQLQAKVNSLRWTRRIRADQKDGPKWRVSKWVPQAAETCWGRGKPPAGYWLPLNKELVDIRKLYQWLKKSGLFDSTAVLNMAAGKAHMEHPNQVAGLMYMNICSNLGLRVRRSKWWLKR